MGYKWGGGGHGYQWDPEVRRIEVCFGRLRRRRRRRRRWCWIYKRKAGIEDAYVYLMP